VLLYGIPILAILLVVPTERITGLAGFIDAMQVVFTVYGGEVRAAAADGSSSQIVVLTGAGRILGGFAAIGFIFTLATSATTWIMGADRCQAVACLDGVGPRVLGGFSSRWGTPVTLNLASGVIATVVMVATFAVTGASAEKYFAASLGLGISTTSISYLGVFPALYLLRRKRSDTRRPYRVPGGDRGAFVVSAVTTAWALLATTSLVWPGFGMRGNADIALPGGFVALDAQGRVLSSQRLLFELTQIVPLVLVAGLGVLFVALGRRERSRAGATANQERA
jgi:amino acid transporter